MVVYSLTFIRFLTALVFVLVLSACGEESAPQQSGAIAPHITWVQHPEGLQGRTITDFGDTLPPDLVTVRISVSAPDMANTIRRFFTAADREGTVDGIPPGANREITVDGLNRDNEVAYSGSVANFTISSGVVSPVEISAYQVDDAIAFDDVAPEIVLTGDNPITLNQGNAFSDPGATATDNRDGDLTQSIQVAGSVDSSLPGTYVLTYTVADAEGNSSSVERNVNILEVVGTGSGSNGDGDVTIPEDTADPVITLNGPNPLTLNQGNSYTELGATVIDNVDGQIETITITGNVDTAVVGNYTITYSVSDAAGNFASTTRSVQVQAVDEDSDTTPPVITLNGANPLTLNEGTAYNEPGATAVDNEDGTLSSIIISGSVDSDTPGSYTVVYSVSDSAGNFQSATRAVTVKDITPPVITLNGDNPMSINEGDSYLEPGATAIDAVDGSAAMAVSGSVNSNVPGTYTINYSASDKSGNGTSVSRTVIVIDVDGEAPVITLNGDNPLTINEGENYSEPGATALDAAEGVVPVSTSGSVNTNSPGSYTITYTATDSMGNASNATRTVTVLDVDDVAPVITLNGSNPMTLDQGDAFSDPGATAEDDVDGVVSVTTTGSVNTNSPGSYTITYTATDSVGNASNATRTVTVLDVDDVAPVITLNGSNMMTLGQGDAFSDPGATAEDDVDGVVSVTTTGSVNNSVPGEYTLTYSASDEAGNTSEVTRTVTVTANVVPTVSAGNDQTVDSAASVSITGSASDSDGVISTYAWTQLSGTSVTLFDADTATLSFTAPTVGSNTTLTFRLTVTDDDGGTNNDDVLVTVEAPLSNCSGDDISCGLIAHYEFDGNANDSSGNGHNGTEYGGISYTSGVDGQAIFFDGTSDYIESSANPDWTSDFSVNVWLKINSENAWSRLLYHLDSTDAHKSTTLQLAGVTSCGGINFSNEWRFYNTETGICGTSEVELISSADWTSFTEQWVMVTVVRSNSTLSMYLDGSLDTSVSSSTLSSVNGALRVGGNGGGEFYSGSMDNLRLYNRALSVSEILELGETSLDQGLVAHYKFDGNANDSSGNGNHGTEHGGVSYTSGVNGQAADFDGVDDYIEAPSSMSGTGSFTLSSWFHSDDTSGLSFLILSDAQTLHTESKFYLDSGSLVYRVGTGSSNQTVSSQSVSEGNWYHIAATYNSTNNQHKAYLNGLETGAATITGQNRGANLLFGVVDGVFYSGPDYFLNGLIDDTRVYSRVLSDAEIQLLYEMD